MLKIVRATTAALLLGFLASLQSADALIPMNLVPYGGAARDQQLANAVACLTALRARLVVRSATNKSPPFANNDNVANCVRYAFHDCGTYDAANPSAGGGCNGAVRLSLASATPPRADGGLNICQNLLVGADGQSGVCGALRSSEPTCANMPFADCISFAGILAFAAKKGTPTTGCAWSPGRVDSTAPRNTSLLPSENGNAAQSIAAFARYGMPVEKFGLTQEKALVLLLGAHTIGKSRVTRESPCSRGLGAMTQTSTKIDTNYYSRMIKSVSKVDNIGGGFFCADITTVCAAVDYGTGAPPVPGQPGGASLRTASCGGKTDSQLFSLVSSLAKGGNKNFFAGFCSAYQAMSLIGYEVPATYESDATAFAALLKPRTSAKVSGR